MKVAITLTISVTTSVRRVLQMSWEKTSWPSCVVPSRCVDDGPRFGAIDGRLGVVGRDQPRERGDERHHEQDQRSGRRLAIAENRADETPRSAGHLEVFGMLGYRDV